MKSIRLRGGGQALVDEDIYDFLNQFKWRLDTCGYARTDRVNRDGKKRAVFMHHLVLGKIPKAGALTDHINCVRTDNRRANLRICIKAENARNSIGWSDKKSSKFKGVFFDDGSRRKPWRAIITCNRKRTHVGRFITEVEAARVYNEAATRLFGEFARLNDLSAPPTNRGGKNA